ncbi:Ger(x)C family spore germination protein [Paenibacillus protaetiae]|uniref:Ger(X)C family spore germination protein n=1 Tax=Paenibacillus protaetiae TaxID=2509456 RepID=A0A4P6F859_9BACL|nr:Ger(x)C family spore germination protein [Paenibacillus protaetiae]QAY66628.1 Ger(x)C family spore germination protein [Paenibacillus protaetiae]
MGKKWVAALKSAAASLLLVMAGCWNQVDLQDMTYISSLGIDYKDGEYRLYANIISPAAVAKQDSSAQTDEGPSSTSRVGEAHGESVLLAIANLSKVSQYIVSLEHLKSIVIHERALPYLSSIFDGINRQRATRGTTWIYGTKDNMIELFQADLMRNVSPLDSILYSPIQVYKQDSFFEPVRMHTFLQAYKEQAMTNLMPSLSLTTKYWTENKKKVAMPEVDGVFVFKDEQNITYMSNEQIQGLHWMQPDFKKDFLKVSDTEGGGGKTKGVTIVIDSTKPGLSAEWHGDKPVFTIKLHAKSHVVEMEKNMTKNEIVHGAEQKIKEEILKTYTFAKQRKADPFLLELHLYRFHNRKWKAMNRQDNWLPPADELRVEVDVLLSSPGKYELLAHK